MVLLDLRCLRMALMVLLLHQTARTALQCPPMELMARRSRLQHNPMCLVALILVDKIRTSTQHGRHRHCAEACLLDMFLMRTSMEDRVTHKENLASLHRSQMWDLYSRPT